MTQTSDSPTRLVLVRHGETDANAAGTWQGASDDPLNGRGHLQAKRVAAQLAAEGLVPAAIYASPLSRARQTAQAIADALPKVDNVHVENGLAEYNLGRWEGLTFQELRNEKRLWERMAVNPHFAPPGGESAVDFTRRVVGAFRHLANRHQGQTVLVVGHGGAMATAIAALLLDDPSRWPEFQMDNCGISELVLAALPRLERFNDVGHL